MASSSRISYPLVWGIVFSTLVALLLGWIVVARTQVASTPQTPTQRNLDYWIAVAKDNKLDGGVQLRLGYAYYRMAQEQKDPAKRKEYLVKALAAYDAAVALNPKMMSNQYNRAIALRDLGRSDEALKVFEKIIKDTKGKTQATFDAAEIYLQRGDTKTAIKRLQQAVAAEPMASDYRFALAKAYAKAGRTKDAISELSYALKMSPDNQEVKSMLTSLTASKKSGGR